MVPAFVCADVDVDGGPKMLRQGLKVKNKFLHDSTPSTTIKLDGKNVKTKRLLAGGGSPAATAPVASSPSAGAPVAASPSANAPVAASPSATAPVAASPTATAPVAASPVAPAPVAASPIATAPVASAPAPVAPAPVAASPTATAPVAASPVAPAPVAASPTVTAPVSASPTVTAPVASAPAPVAASPTATAPVASAPVAGFPSATAPMASAPVFSSPTATAPVAAAPMASAPVPAPPVNTDSGDFCWLDSSGRGVGTIPDTCASDREKIGLLCYSMCPQGTARFGFDCHSVCPPNMRDDGLEYGRGEGYPWQFGDGFNLDNARGRCEGDNGGPDTCEKNGEIYYPKCASGFSAFGCCICRPNPPDCGALGLGGQFDLSCAKNIIVGDPTPMQCGSNLQMDAGLCYSTCSSGSTGVGPVCWSSPPSGWVSCGLGAAKDSSTCDSIVFGQVSAVGQLAITIGSLGAGAGAGAVNTGGKIEELLAKWKEIKELPEVQMAIQNAKDTAFVFKLVNFLNGDLVPNSPEEAVRLSAEVASFFDTSGISSTVAAFTYARCSTIVP